MTKEQEQVVKRLTKRFKGKAWSAKVVGMADTNVVVEVRCYVSPPKEITINPLGEAIKYRSC